MLTKLRISSSSVVYQAEVVENNYSTDQGVDLERASKKDNACKPLESGYDPVFVFSHIRPVLEDPYAPLHATCPDSAALTLEGPCT